MPHYRLVPSGRPDVSVDNIILSRDEAGEPDVVLSRHSVVELSDEHYQKAVNHAGRLNYKVVEAPAPEEDEENEGQDQDVGIDAEAQAPRVDASQTDQESVAAARSGDTPGTSTAAGPASTGTVGAPATTVTPGVSSGSTPATPNT